jgi:hypothetical protein
VIALGLLAVLAGLSQAAGIKTVPLEGLTLPLTGPAASVKNPLGPENLALSINPASPLAPAPGLTIAQTAVTAAARIPPAASSDPKDPKAASSEFRPAAQPQERDDKRDTGAQETAEELVRRLLKKGREESRELAAAFDGEAALMAVGLEAPADGEVRKTRHGEYTLAFTEVSEEGSQTVLLERWEGPHGGLWVQHKRGLSSWMMREYRGKTKPFKGLPHSAHAEFEITAQKRLWGIVETAPENGPSSVMVDAKKAFKDAAEYLDGQYSGIKGSWTYGTNLAIFNKLTGEGKSPEVAALATWTGQRAVELGYTKVVFSGEGLKQLQTGVPGKYEAMSALFRRP